MDTHGRRTPGPASTRAATLPRPTRRRLPRAVLGMLLAIASLVALGTGHASAVVAGANGQILFTRQICDSGTDPCWEIVVANADDSAETVVAGPYPRSAWDDHFIANWSPDGRQVVFMADLGDGQAIWRVRADGAHLHKVFTPPAGTFLDDGVAYTPDGRHLVFTRCCPAISGYALWQVRSDGTHLQQLTSEAVPPGVDGPADGVPQVAPDGRSVVFQHDDSAGDTVIAVAQYPSGHFRTLTPPGFDAQIPNWSPDGRQIVFQSSGNVWAVRPDGSDLRQLTFDSGVDTRDVNPSYAPDGSVIVFSRVAGDQRDVYTMNPDGTGMRQVTRTEAKESFAQWAAAADGD